MRRFSCTRLLALLPVALLALLAVDASPARAAHEMPDVVGHTQRAAVRTLEAEGLRVNVVTIAGHPPGVVASQDPAAGEPVESGDEVEIHVGVRISIDTTAPNVVGMTEEQVIDALDETYFLEIEFVRGPPHRDGRVKSQHPAAGATVPFRGVFRVQIVRNAAEVPAVVGRLEAEALELLDQAGLAARITYVRSGPGREGLVLSQLPRSGSEILPGGTVELTVRGERTRVDRRRRVRVPDLAGLAMRDAENVLLGLGLMPHEHLVSAGGAAAWSVLSQEVAAGTVVPEGSDIGFNVAKPAGTPSRVRVPMLYGKSQSEARDLLAHLGLRSTATAVDSALPAGTVVWQSRSPGSLVRVSYELAMRVARTPAADWTPSRVRVPQLDNRTAGAAIVALMTRNLNWRLQRDTGPNEDVNRVFRQEPDAGTRVAEGTTVTVYLPLRATMPNLLGETRLQALEILQGAGLQGLGVLLGSAGGGVTEVVRQDHPHGKILARGSLAKFRYRTHPAPAALAHVPRVIGMDTGRADATLQAAGFRVVLRALHFGTGGTVVVSQIPAAGSTVPPGSVITATYRYAGTTGPWGTLVRVPRVIGLTREAAVARLRGLGFSVRSTRAGPSNPYYGTSVVAQSPLAGTMLVRGARVAITYRFVPRGGSGGGITTTVVVPNVVGLRVDRAIARLRAAGLSVTVSGLGTRVRSQSRGAGSRVRRGTSVTLRVRL